METAGMENDAPPEGADDGLATGLYIIATPIGNIRDITYRAVDALRKVDVVACEDTRESGKLLSAYGIKADKLPYHDHNGAEMRPQILKRLSAGQSVALISDAGMPLVSDPGYKLVQAAIAAGHHVTCLPGATASLTGLSLSGLPSDRFMFAGFLPPKGGARRTALGELATVPATLIFYETAPRLAEALQDMAAVLGPRQAAVARELTKKFEEVRRGDLSALAAHYVAEGPPKGEIVLIVDGPGAAKGWGDAEIAAALQGKLRDEKLSVKDAAAAVALAAGRKKSEVYDRALKIRDALRDGET